MDEVYQSLVFTSAARSDRQKAADLILMNPSRLNQLLHHCFSDDKQISHKACWVLEFVCHKHLEWLIPELDVFLEKIPYLKNESAIRSTAKICELVAEKYIHNRSQMVLNLTSEHIGQIVEQCFDWLIGDHKVATKAYSMQALFYLRHLQPWIAPQLKQILLEQRDLHSAAYQARSRHLLRKL